ncbi:MAG: M28 family peptidase [Thermoleophilaceae bacterium]
MSVAAQRRPAEATLREVVEALAPIERPPCSDGERRAAEWLAERFRATGARVDIEQGTGYGTFPPTVLAIGAMAAASAGLALRGRRAAATLGAAAAVAAYADEIENGPRVFRRAIRRERQLTSVVARLGDDRAERTLVVIAHHDAPQTGAIYDQGLQRKAFEVAPEFMDRFRTSIPLWWIGLLGPIGTVATVLSGRPGPARAGTIAALLGLAAMADVARSETVQGANDNLSGAAGLVALAEMLAERPVDGLRVLLVSCGAEESLQDGIRAFMQDHRHELPQQRTWFVNLETIGSPMLAMIEGEGPLVMRDYTDPSFRELVAGAAARAGLALERDLRSRASTDSVIPSRAGYPTATLASVTAWRSLANYHWPSDVPANLDYGTVSDAVALAYAVAEALAAEPTGRT